MGSFSNEVTHYSLPLSGMELARLELAAFSLQTRRSTIELQSHDLLSQSIVWEEKVFTTDLKPVVLTSTKPRTELTAEKSFSTTLFF